MSSLDVDARLVRALAEFEAEAPSAHNDAVSDDTLLAYAIAQFRSRPLDFTARDLQKRGEGFYTIGSAGHEANARVPFPRAAPNSGAILPDLTPHEFLRFSHWECR